MQYLKSFDLPSDSTELDFLFSKESYKLNMTSYRTDSAYPFLMFPKRGLGHIEFAPITIFYGGNGSGKSTVLNVIAEKLSIPRSAPFNTSPHFEDYLQYCRYSLCPRVKRIPQGSEIISSDSVFDYLLDARAINDRVDRRREELFDEYKKLTYSGWQISSLEDYDELKRRNEIRRSTKNQYVASRLEMRELPLKSNGESAFAYFTERIKENALYLLDEPENSLSAELQRKLAGFLIETVRFFDCQLIISTHSPFLLSMRDAVIYDLDSTPVEVKRWSELPNVRAYYELFRDRAGEFED